MKISFRVVETSQKGQSLLQWNDGDRATIGSLHSLQMPSEVAQYIMESCNARPVVLDFLNDARCGIVDGEKIGTFLKYHWRS